jgi:hypothetical protein
MSKSKVAQVSAHTIINQLPDQSKRMVLYAVLGSLNSHIINNAQAVVSRLTRDGVDFKDYELAEVIHLMEEPDWRQDTLLNVRRVMSVAQGLRDQLIELTNDDTAGAISDAIEYRSKPAPVRAMDYERFRATAIATRIIKQDASESFVRDMMKASADRQKLDNERSAERTAGMRGNIEWVIDHVFNPDTGYEQPDNIEDLHRELKAQIFEVIRNRIESERIACLNELMSSRRTPRYSLADATLLADTADMAEMLDAHLEEATID